MTGTRSSTRQATAAASSSPYSSRSKASTDGTANTKRKADDNFASKSKRGRKGNTKKQQTIEDALPHNDDETDTKTKDEPGIAEEKQSKEAKLDEEEREDIEKAKKQSLCEGKSQQIGENSSTHEDAPHPDEIGKVELKDSAKVAVDDKAAFQGDAVEKSSDREHSMPSSILEKGIIYFFFRGRVGINEPSDVNEIARSYIILRPLPHGAKLGDGTITDADNNCLLALPKKVLPVSGKDRFMLFVEKANASIEDIKKSLTSSDYITKTAGSRHTPAAAPIGEGIYALTTTGRESHLAYMLTIPSEMSEVQEDVGLKARGSFITSLKNPQYPGPGNTNLPKGADYPPKILDEFRGLRWMPLQPKYLNYENSQILIIGESSGLDKATEKQGEDEHDEKKAPLEAMEELEHEDEIRVEHLKGDDSVFEDLSLSSKEYPKVKTTW